QVVVFGGNNWSLLSGSEAPAKQKYKLTVLLVFSLILPLTVCTVENSVFAGGFPFWNRNRCI
uniref:Uncharacterized protein n=1 Tax=Anopheles atroparvus TaxID=41427 RepID=A0AAG5D5N1_ANOAO